MTAATSGPKARPAKAPAPPTAEARSPGPPWTVLGLIRWSTTYLAARGVDAARLDAEHLLAHALGTGRLQLYLEHDRPLSPSELATFKPLLLRRARREPVQYITGRAAFRDLELCCDARGLVPRPETEVLVDVVLEWAHSRSGLEALDLGTGSGCIALALAGGGPFRRVVGTDIDREALELARVNAAALPQGERVELRLGSLFGPVPGECFDVVVSNPPYVRESEAESLDPEIRDWEPAAALYGGESGLKVMVPLVREAPAHLRPSGLLAVEVGEGQAHSVTDLVSATPGLGTAEVHRDLAGRARIVTALRGDP